MKHSPHCIVYKTASFIFLASLVSFVGCSSKLSSNGSASDIVSETFPKDGATDVSITTPIYVVLSKDFEIDPKTLEASSLSLLDKSGKVVATKSDYGIDEDPTDDDEDDADEKEETYLYLYLASPLKINTKYTVSLNGKVSSLSGLSVEKASNGDFQWSFTTQLVNPDEIIPTGNPDPDPDPNVCSDSKDCDEGKECLFGICSEASTSENDADNDGILDNADNCPSVANPKQTDTDKDGLVNSCDDESDGDGIINEQDNCYYTPNADQADKDNDGEGDACDVTKESNISFSLKCPDNFYIVAVKVDYSYWLHGLSLICKNKNSDKIETVLGIGGRPITQVISAPKGNILAGFENTSCDYNQETVICIFRLIGKKSVGDPQPSWKSNKFGETGTNPVKSEHICPVSQYFIGVTGHYNNYDKIPAIVNDIDLICQ